MTSAKRIAQTLQGIVLTVFGAGLGLYAWMGKFTRYWSDDWCFNRDVKTIGLAGMLRGYVDITYYSSNRVSQVISTYFLQLGGLYGVQFLPLLLIFGWWAAFTVSVANLNKFFGIGYRRLQIGIISAGIVFVTIYLAPNQFQSIYWRAASLPYIAALTGNLAVFALVTRQMIRPARSRWIEWMVGPIALFSGMFSETGGAFLLTWLVMLVAAALLFRRRGEKWPGLTLPALLISILFSILALIVMMASPAIPQRLTFYPARPALWVVPFRAVLYSAEFALLALKGTILPCLAIFGLFLGLALIQKPAARFTGRQLFMFLLVMSAAIWLLMAANQAPTVYVEGGPPHPRALIISQFVFTLLLALWAWGVGVWLGERLPANAGTWAASLFMLAAAVYFARGVWLETRHVDGFAQRAQVWDERDTLIRSSVSAGAESLHVRAIDGASMDHTRDLKDDPKFWLNACAAEYYGLKEIIADQR